MLSALLGIVTGWLSQFIFIGYALIEALVGFWAFNYLAPKIPQYGYELPFDHIYFWHLFAFIIIINIFGSWIKRLTPKIIEIKNRESSNSNQ